MRNERLWVLILALVCLLCGGGAGYLVSELRRPAEVARGPFADYERLLVERFDLGQERADLLHALLQHYANEIDGIRNQYTASSLSAMEPELREQGVTFRNLIRERVLPEGRRAEFDRLCRAGEFDPSEM